MSPNTLSQSDPNDPMPKSENKSANVPGLSGGQDGVCYAHALRK